MVDIFISHISEEAPLAKCLKTAIEDTFPSKCNVFVSSDPSDIPAGDKWPISITNALKNCKILMISCTPRSLSRPWINFESGAGWVRDIPVIPICHSGLTKDDLPMPLSSLQGLDLDNQFPSLLFSAINHHLKLGGVPGNIDYSKIYSSLETSRASIKYSSEIEHEQTSKLDDDLPQEHKKILLLFAEQDGCRFMAEIIADHLKCNITRAKHYLSDLADKQFIVLHRRISSPNEYSIGRKGREYLVKKNLI